MPELRCIVVDDEPPARKRVRELLKQASEIELVGEARNGIEAVELIDSLRPDVVFLDVQMPELDGFGVLAELDTPPPAVVFVTAYDAYALKAFEVHALDYLLKPFDRERFEAALDRARAVVGQHHGSTDPRLLALLGDLTNRGKWLSRIAVKSGGRIRLVDVADVEWVEASGNYLRLNAEGARHLIRDTMQGLEARLDPDQFTRIHRSTMINIGRVKELAPSSHGDYTVTMQSGQRLTLSRTYRERLKTLLGPEI